MKPRAAVYLRVSGDDQDVEHQRPKCLAICAERGWLPIVIEETESGAKKRTGWREVERMATSGEITAVVVWALDRVGRSLWSIADAVRMFDKHNVRVVSVEEPWLDVPTAPGPDGTMTDSQMVRSLLVRMWDWLAAMERRRLISRTKAAHVTARKRGKKIGRPRKMSPLALADAVALYTSATPPPPASAIQDYLWKKHGKKFARGTIFTAIKEVIDGNTQAERRRLEAG